MLVVALAGCAAGPAYSPPAADMPVAWKLESPWRTATPDDTAPKGPWWLRFDDPQLDTLQRQALTANPTLELAAARLAQARAVVGSTSAARFPQVTLGLRAQRARISPNRPLSNYGTPNFATVQNDFVDLLSASYEVDLAGRVQRTIEGAEASAEQAAADLESTRLVLGADHFWCVDRRTNLLSDMDSNLLPPFVYRVAHHALLRLFFRFGHSRS